MRKLRCLAKLRLSLFVLPMPVRWNLRAGCLRVNRPFVLEGWAAPMADEREFPIYPRDALRGRASRRARWRSSDDWDYGQSPGGNHLAVRAMQNESLPKK
jgi:hypothetical protein